MNLNEKLEVVRRFPLGLYFKKNDVKLCPDCKSASLQVSDKHQIWKCFSCSAGGDALRLYEKLYGRSFPETVEMMFQDIYDEEKASYFSELRTMSIIDAVKLINKERGPCLPQLGSSFVWGQKRICEFFDSIMKEHPLGIIINLVTHKKLKAQKFTRSYSKNIDEEELEILPNEVKKHLVVDGQHRLQALYIGLEGSYEGKSLCLNVLSKPEEYQIEFKEDKKVTFPWVRFKDLVYSNTSLNTSAGSILERAPITLTDNELNLIAGNVSSAIRIFHERETMVFKELHWEMGTDKIAELIQRVNWQKKKFETLKL